MLNGMNLGGDNSHVNDKTGNGRSVGASPVPDKINGVGWYKDIAGVVCQNVGLEMVTIEQTGAAATVRLLIPNEGHELWNVSWEEVCYTHGEMCAMAERMVNQARQNQKK